MMVKIVDSDQTSWVQSWLHDLCVTLGKLLNFPGLGVLIGDIRIGHQF